MRGNMFTHSGIMPYDDALEHICDDYPMTRAYIEFDRTIRCPYCKKRFEK
jgi:hypothetical protein